jgi:1-acyl-sn-glycerol-3-phosphate acyltransferase
LDFIYKIFGINIEVEKKENLMKNKAYILVANHQSSIDYIGIFKK